MAVNSVSSLRPGTFLHIGGMEERALEGVALHAQLQIGVAGFFARDLERIEIEDADLVVDDVLLRPHREGLPDRFGDCPDCSG